MARYAYRQLAGPASRAPRRSVGKAIRKSAPGYRAPAFYPSSDYVRTGPTVVLPADAAYYANYPADPAHVFRHHLFQPYYYLAERLP